VDNLSKDTTERDLWDLDDLLLDGDGPAPRAAIEPIRRVGLPTAPEPKPSQAKSADSKAGPAVPILNARPNVVRRISKAERSRSPLASTASSGVEAPEPQAYGDPNAMESAFDDLEQWESPAGPAPVAAPVEEEFADLSDEAAQPAAVPSATGAAAAPRDMAVTAPPPAAAQPAAPAAADSDDEFAPHGSPTAKPVSLLPSLKLSLFEKIGLACLAIILLGGGIWAYRSTISRMGGGTSDQAIRFPVRGAHVAITGVKSYWREPMKPEIVRRGVMLIPVVEITVSGQGAIRVLFSNDMGSDVGDPMIREVSGETTLVIPATVGFEDAAMHAAYQAGLTRPWHVKIAEAKSANAAGSEFKDLAKPPLEPQLR